MPQAKSPPSSAGRLDALVAGPAARVSAAQPDFDWAPFPGLPGPGRTFLAHLLQLQLLAPEMVRHFLELKESEIARLAEPESVGQRLVEDELLTPYQLERVLAGRTHGLVLGNYRVLERLGAGSMAVVFLAEHYLMKRRVAVKVLPVDENCPPDLWERFYAEIHLLADLRHPNIVLALDAGELPPPDTGLPWLVYLVMELVDGGDLEGQVREHGPAPIAQACDWIRQAACGLQAAHDRHLIHRDVKPSNMLLTQQGAVKVVDFGLARQFSSNITSPRALLGSVEFMAPEQSQNATLVGAEADVYGLGASLFWLLTGAMPHPQQPTLASAVQALQDEPALKLRDLRPEAPATLEALIEQMLERDPSKRPASPLAVMKALTPFASSVVLIDFDADAAQGTVALPATRLSTEGLGQPRERRVLIVDGDENLCVRAAEALQPLGCRCDYTAEGELALAALWEQRYELLLLGRRPIDIDGYVLCRRLRERPHGPNLRIIFLADGGADEDLGEALVHGADDALAKPFELKQLVAKVRHELHVKETLDRYEKLARDLHVANRQLSDSLESRDGDVKHAQDALLFAMTKLAESHDGETAGHLRRLQQFSRCLAVAVADDRAWSFAGQPTFLEQLERCVPLHDIGKLGLPDKLLSKPGSFDAAERALMQTHTVIGSNILDALHQEHGGALSFLGMARAIVRHHHERYDGRGYPDGLVGEEIPHAARLVALADVYDALRRQRFHKPPLPHADAARYILQESAGQFDPRVRQAFAACQRELERVYREVPE